jgi:hypothetical protein
MVLEAVITHDPIGTDAFRASHTTELNMETTVNVKIDVEVEGKWSTLDTMNTDADGLAAVFEHAKRKLFGGDGAGVPVRIVIGPEKPDADTFDAEQVVASLETNW